MGIRKPRGGGWVNLLDVDDRDRPGFKMMGFREDGQKRAAERHAAFKRRGPWSKRLQGLRRGPRGIMECDNGQ